jgi:hypothetical protein
LAPLLICFETQMNTVHNLHHFLNLQELWSNYRVFTRQYLLLHSLHNVQLPEKLLKDLEQKPATKKSTAKLGEKMKFCSRERITMRSPFSVSTKWCTETPSRKQYPLCHALRNLRMMTKTLEGTWFAFFLLNQYFKF